MLCAVGTCVHNERDWTQMKLPSFRRRRRLGGIKRLWPIPIAIVLSLVGFFYRQEVPPVLAQSAVDSLTEIPVATTGQRIMVISPHPDDETIGAGGYIAAATGAGAEVEIVLVTDGNKHGLKSVRHVEFENATRMLGVPAGDLVFLDFPDGTLAREGNSTLQSALHAQVELFHPDVVVYPDQRDANPDHYTIGRVMDKVLDTETWSITRYQYLVHFEIVYPRPRKFDPNLYLMPPRHLLTFDRSWHRFALSPDEENVKKAAIFAYRSQLNSPWLKGILLSSIRKNELFSLPVTSH